MIHSIVKQSMKFSLQKFCIKDYFPQSYRLLRHSTKIERPTHLEQEVLLTDAEQLTLSKEIINKVNSQIKSNLYGRLFAVIYISGRQHVVTTEDLLVIKSPIPPTIGDKIRLEKVLAVGGSDFTLLGRPLLPKDLVYVEGIVVEKLLEATKVFFKYHKKALNFSRNNLTVLRINNIRLDHPVDEHPTVEGVEGRTF